MQFTEVMKYTPNKDYLETLIYDNNIDRVYIVQKYLEHWSLGGSIDNKINKIYECRGTLNVVWKDIHSFWMNFLDAERIWMACNEICINHYIQNEDRLIRECYGDESETYITIVH